MLTVTFRSAMKLRLQKFVFDTSLVQNDLQIAKMEFWFGFCAKRPVLRTERKVELG